MSKSLLYGKIHVQVKLEFAGPRRRNTSIHTLSGDRIFFEHALFRVPSGSANRICWYADLFSRYTFGYCARSRTLRLIFLNWTIRDVKRRAWKNRLRLRKVTGRTGARCLRDEADEAFQQRSWRKKHSKKVEKKWRKQNKTNDYFRVDW
jgi:hypothetical protein